MSEVAFLSGIAARPYVPGGGTAGGSSAPTAAAQSSSATVPLPSALEAAPERLLQRIQALEHRLTEQEKKMTEAYRRIALLEGKVNPPSLAPPSRGVGQSPSLQQAPPQ